MNRHKVMKSFSEVVTVIRGLLSPTASTVIVGISSYVVAVVYGLILGLIDVYDSARCRLNPELPACVQKRNLTYHHLQYAGAIMLKASRHHEASEHC